MKIKMLTILSLLLFVTACSNGNKETTKDCFGNKEKTKINSDKSDSSSTSDTASKLTDPTTSSMEAKDSNLNVPNESNSSVAQITNQEYVTDLFPSAYNPNDSEKLRDGFYIAPANNISIISQYTNMHETEIVIVNNEDRDSFLAWIRKIAPSGHTDNGLISNYRYWSLNVNDK
ncbi:hypothetical protein ACVRWQ_04000 [Streptococcus phocae subsp. salmonis]|uniref:hypothetical protein n=1 Tax=Streptococcus phocae TaxID=119224 RepID=UPI00053153A6|nr:hypothetical protein [Streptococcus phocae]KGR73271.1 hypothetical protein NX86_01385 [Streptococcus phocae subsp. salmonis]